MSKLTIRDIAKMAGVSPTVVSFVINGKDGVNEKTRQKVLDIVSSTGFKPNTSSRRLIMKKSFNIGIAIRSSTASPFSDLFYYEIAQGLLEKSKEYGYNIVFTDTEGSAGELTVPDIVLKGDVDGLIFLQDIDDYLLNTLAKRNLPTVLIDYQGNSNSLYSVNADYVVSARVATKYLIDRGHRDIAFISSNFAPGFYQQVFKGFSEVIQSGNILIPLGWVCTANNDAEVREAVGSLLASERRPTAVFCSTDIIAIEAMRQAKQHGLRVPEDISFIGIDDVLLSRFVEPPLTSIRIDKRMMGVYAMELIMKLINEEPADCVLVRSDEIIERDSVADISGSKA